MHFEENTALDIRFWECREKHYIFYRYLSKKLKPKAKEKVNIEHLIDLESLRIQKLHD